MSMKNNTREIIEKLKVLSSKGIKNYSNSVDAWLQSSAYKIDSDEKQTALKLMFEKSESCSNLWFCRNR